MAKSATEIERDIRVALGKCRLLARGLWHEMRHVIEMESTTPGELRRGRVPVSVEQLAEEVRCSATKARSLAEKLVSVGLLDQTEAGVWYSKRLARIHDVRVGQRQRTAKCRGEDVPQKRRRRGRGSERVLRNTIEGVTCAAGNTGVTPLGSPSAPSLPTPLSPTPPTPGDLRSASGRAAEGDSAAVRTEPGFTWALSGMPPVPESLRTPRMLAALDEFLVHRRERKPKLTPTAARRQLARLEEWGEPRAHAATLHSIANSYQGIFESNDRKESSNGSNRQPAPRSADGRSAARGEYGGPTDLGVRQLPKRAAGGAEPAGAGAPKIPA